MKNSRTLIYIIAISLNFYTAISSASEGLFVHTTITDVRWYGENDHGYVTTASSRAPSNCSTGTSTHRYFNAQQPGHNKMLAIALTAMATGKPVEVYLSGCNPDNTNYSKLDGIIIKNN